MIGPMDLIVVWVLLALQVGFWAAAAGVIVVLATIALQVKFGHLIGARRRVTAVRTDERIKIVTEVRRKEICFPKNVYRISSSTFPHYRS